MAMICRSLVAIALIPVTGCATRTWLIATPTLCLQPDGAQAMHQVAAGLCVCEMEILYAADRSVVKETKFGPVYGYGRAGQLAFGVAKVALEPDLDWDELVKQCTIENRDVRIRLQLESATEYGRLALPLDGMEVRDGRYRLPQPAIEELAQTREKLHEILDKRLEQAPRKDVFIFVHGFNNSFEDAVFRLAQLWHFMGRVGVPIAYTWPAGRGGLFGYAYDRESGEFTVYHLKRFLLAVSSCPEVERIHLIAHSRGTDVVITALRELHIEFKAKGQSTHEVLKLDDLVLAAPDLDADVFEQRFAIEDLHLVANRTTVYLSKSDVALSMSNWLFGGRSRLGRLTAEEFTPDARSKLSRLAGFTMIECQVSGHSTSHDYAFAHPAVVSDMILLLRDDRAPGAENGRPLQQPAEGVWQITNEYLRPDKSARNGRLARRPRRVPVTARRRRAPNAPAGACRSRLAETKPSCPRGCFPSDAGRIDRR